MNKVESRLTKTGKRKCISILACLLLLPVFLYAALMFGGSDAHASQSLFSDEVELDDFNGKRIGIQTGTTFAQMVEEQLPDAEISYFSNYADMIAALESEKIDGFPIDTISLSLMAAEDERMVAARDYLTYFEVGFVLPRTKEGEDLKEELDDWIEDMDESGKLEVVIDRWMEDIYDVYPAPDFESLPNIRGSLIMATEGAFPPLNYYRGEDLVGIEVDLGTMFARDHGYALQINDMNFDGILAAVQSGKADFAAAGIAYTDERAEQVLFSEPYLIIGTVMAFMEKEDMGGPATFFSDVAESFQKTFIREDRWVLFLKGIFNTLIITLFSILFGTILGFLIYLLCRNGNPVANAITGAATWFVQGTPMIVLLMILYYIIFGSVAINGITVAILGFTLTFGSGVMGLLKMGVGAIDRGQFEAAYALGYSNRRTFFRIILPQVIPHIMPAYKGEIVSLIKATAIVGYIAVKDLTKMGDIVRSRTYEAFFPLIAISVIYFLLEGLFAFLISRIQFSIDPKKRKRRRILKGIDTHD